MCVRVACPLCDPSVTHRCHTAAITTPGFPSQGHSTHIPRAVRCVPGAPLVCMASTVDTCSGWLSCYPHGQCGPPSTGGPARTQCCCSHWPERHTPLAALSCRTQQLHSIKVKPKEKQSTGKQGRELREGREQAHGVEIKSSKRPGTKTYCSSG